MPAVPLESRLLQALAPWREAGAGAWRFPAGWIPRCCCICSPNWPGAKPCRRCRRCMSTMACRLRRTVGRRTARWSAGRWVSRCGSSGCRSPLAAASSRRRATPAIAHSRRTWARDRCCSPRSTSTTRPRPCCSACCVERACAAWRRCRRAGRWAAAACADPCSGFPRRTGSLCADAPAGLGGGSFQPGSALLAQLPAPGDHAASRLPLAAGRRRHGALRGASARGRRPAG